MSDFTCETVRPFLPDLVEGSLPPDQLAGVEAHVATCDECASETHVLQALRRARPEPPEGLAVRIQSALRSGNQSSGDASRRPTGAPRGSGGPAPWWAPLQRPGLAAAAATVVALGTSLIWLQVGGGGLPSDMGPDVDAPPMVEFWAEDAGIVAGAPVLEELSDEQLLVLLEELEG